jgi:zinc and cadmium transporter
MEQVWVYAIASVLIVSVVSLIGVVTLSIHNDKLQKWLLYLVSFSVGALLGDVFLHILPEMAEEGLSVSDGGYILAGILIFFILERFILWQHHHGGEHEESVHSVAYLTVVGDSLHNFLDGMIIASAYLISIPVGVATTLAVVFHEIPQEIGNFAILIHGGWSKSKALLYNFLSALAAVLGAIVVLVFIGNEVEAPRWLLSMGVASFIYIAMADIIPQLNEEKNGKKSILQLAWLVVGIGVMAVLLLLE